VESKEKAPFNRLPGWVKKLPKNRRNGQALLNVWQEGRESEGQEILTFTWRYSKKPVNERG